MVLKQKYKSKAFVKGNGVKDNDDGYDLQYWYSESETEDNTEEETSQIKK